YPGTATRLCDRCAPGASLIRRRPPQYGYAIPLPDAARATWICAWAVECNGEQPQGALLLHHRCRTATTRQRERGVGSHGFHHACGPSVAGLKSLRRNPWQRCVNGCVVYGERSVETDVKARWKKNSDRI